MYNTNNTDEHEESGHEADVRTTPVEVQDVEIDLDANQATVIYEEDVLVDDLFDQQGELRLWEDQRGWKGYRIEQKDDGSMAYYYVNTRPEGHDVDARVSDTVILDTIREHIKNPDAGGPGVFATRCTPVKDDA